MYGQPDLLPKHPFCEQIFLNTLLSTVSASELYSAGETLNYWKTWKY